MWDLIVLIILLITWYAFWHMAEKKHYKKIIEKEKEHREMVVLSKKDAKVLWVTWTLLVTSNIVLSIDYFKKFIAWFIHFFWWRMKVYETLLDRARRDTLVNIKEQAKKKWYDAIVNLRLETSSISKWAKWSIWSVEVLAYATAVRLPK